MRRPLVFNAFTMNTVSLMQHGQWRHPDTRQLEFNSMAPWLELAQILERGRFDTMFLADVAGAYEAYRGGIETSIREGVQIPSNDPMLLIPAMAEATENIGFALTSSIFQDHPFSFARRVSTLDHLTGGRVGWNIVTSYLPSTARNFGIGPLPSGAERYAWADEYMEVVYKLWEGSWEDDAVLRDVERGIYADPKKVHKINHVGERYSVEGPHLCEPSPQRTPFLFQAGASAAGRDFAGRHAEGTFLMASRSKGSAVTQEIRKTAKDAGRAAEDIHCVQLVLPIVGSTEEEAQRKANDLDDWASLEGMLAHMSGNVGVDLSVIEPDRKISDIRPDEIQNQGIRSMLGGTGLPANATFGDLARQNSHQFRLVGTPESIADELEGWAAEADLDGFNIMFHRTPGTFVDFIDQVGPILQERGLMQREYAPGTAREKAFGKSARLPDTHPAVSMPGKFGWTRSASSPSTDWNEGK